MKFRTTLSFCTRNCNIQTSKRYQKLDLGTMVHRKSNTLMFPVAQLRHSGSRKQFLTVYGLNKHKRYISGDAFLGHVKWWHQLALWKLIIILSDPQSRFNLIKESKWWMTSIRGGCMTRTRYLQPRSPRPRWPRQWLLINSVGQCVQEVAIFWHITLFSNSDIRYHNLHQWGVPVNNQLSPGFWQVIICVQWSL